MCVRGGARVSPRRERRACLCRFRALCEKLLPILASLLEFSPFGRHLRRCCFFLCIRRCWMRPILNGGNIRQQFLDKIRPRDPKGKFPKMAGTEVRNNQIIFRKYVEGWPTEEHVEFVTSTKKLELADGSSDVLVKVLYLSCDPYMRGRMRDDQTSYVPPYTIGQPLNGFGVGKVVLSNNPKFKENDYVVGIMGWEEYSLGLFLRKCGSELPLSYNLGALGMAGFTAWVGFFTVCEPKKGETIYVSAASGAVGQMVGQFAKLHGCYVVGSAGSQEKVDLLKSKFKYDAAFNYKEEPDLGATLKRYCPNGIDLYFENVGGEMLSAVLLNANNFARIAACGMISQYNKEKKDPVYNLEIIVKRRMKIQGFLQSDYIAQTDEFIKTVTKWFVEKKLEYVEDVAYGLEQAPTALFGLFSGKNVGKQSVKIADDE